MQIIELIEKKERMVTMMVWMFLIKGKVVMFWKLLKRTGVVKQILLVIEEREVKKAKEEKIKVIQEEINFKNDNNESKFKTK